MLPNEIFTISDAELFAQFKGISHRLREWCEGDPLPFFKELTGHKLVTAIRQDGTKQIFWVPNSFEIPNPGVVASHVAELCVTEAPFSYELQRVVKLPGGFRRLIRAD